jgi:hypothetical protein
LATLSASIAAEKASMGKSGIREKADPDGCFFGGLGHLSLFAAAGGLALLCKTLA